VVNVAFCATTNKLVFEINSVAALLAIAPRFNDLVNVSWSVVGSNERIPVSGVIVTARPRNDETQWLKYDFVSRYFAPWKGINEDPVTGSAHTVLAVYWSKLLGKTTMEAYQASSRGGQLTVELTENNRVLLGGFAVTVVKGTLNPV
jgi:predicted PhzF superfamily epimerase YddE/YHI9